MNPNPQNLFAKLPAPEATPNRKQGKTTTMSDQLTKTPQTSRRDRAILALLENPTLEKAAEVVAVHPTTLRRWLRQPDFHQALQQARHEAFSQSMRRLQQGANPAVGTLFRITRGAGTPDTRRGCA